MGNLFSRHNDVLSEDQQIAAGNDRDPEAGAGAGAGTPSPPPRRSQDSGLELVLPPTTKMTTHQFFYVFILDGIGAMVLSGAINFAIAYGKPSHHLILILCTFLVYQDCPSLFLPQASIFPTTV